MSYQLIIYPRPIDAHCEFAHDTGGWTLIAQPITTPNGTAAQAITVPDGTPNLNGITVTITAPKKAPTVQHAILMLKDGHIPWPLGDTQAALVTDVYVLSESHSTLPKLGVQGQFLVQE